MPEFTITMRLKDQPETKHEVHIVAETLEQAITYVKEKYKDTIYEVDPTSMGLSHEINGAGGPMRPVQPSHTSGSSSSSSSRNPTRINTFQQVKDVIKQFEEHPDIYKIEWDKVAREYVTVTHMPTGEEVYKALKKVGDVWIVRYTSEFFQSSGSKGPSSSTNGIQYQVLKSQFEKAKRENWSTAVSSGFIATEVDWVNEEHVHLKDGRILNITDLNRRELEEAAEAVGISPKKGNPSNIDWEEVERRVTLSYEALGHPMERDKPVKEGVHYTVLAYTDWADMFVPTVIKWAHEEVDSFTDHSNTMVNRSKARKYVEVHGSPFSPTSGNPSPALQMVKRCSDLPPAQRAKCIEKMGNPDGEEVWFGINVADLTEVPMIETMGALFLPPQEQSYTVLTGPNIDDNYVFWHLPKEKAEGIEFILKRKSPRIRIKTLTRPPKPYKKRR